MPAEWPAQHYGSQQFGSAAVPKSKLLSVGWLGMAGCSRCGGSCCGPASSTGPVRQPGAAAALLQGVSVLIVAARQCPSTAADCLLMLLLLPLLVGMQVPIALPVGGCDLLPLLFPDVPWAGFTSATPCCACGVAAES